MNADDLLGMALIALSLNLPREDTADLRKKITAYLDSPKKPMTEEQLDNIVCLERHIK